MVQIFLDPRGELPVIEEFLRVVAHVDAEDHVAASARLLAGLHLLERRGDLADPGGVVNRVGRLSGSLAPGLGFVEAAERVLDGLLTLGDLHRRLERRFAALLE